MDQAAQNIISFLEHTWLDLASYSKIEEIVTKKQGKGLGGNIQLEVRLALGLLGRKPGILVDIGANVGDYAYEMLSIHQRLKAILFEPSIVNTEKLHTRFQYQPNVHVVQHAASNENKDTILYSNVPGSGLGSLYNRNLDHHGLKLSHKSKIKCVRLDDYLRSAFPEIRYIDILKLDVEGDELNVLKGAGEFLVRSKIIQFEFGGCNIDSRTFYRDFHSLFTENFFSVYRITERGLLGPIVYNENCEYFSTTNYIAVNNMLPSW